MERRFRPGGLANIDLTGANLPISGGINYTTGPDGSRAEIDLNKTFEGRMGSVTPSIGYTDERNSGSFGNANVDDSANTIRVGVDGQTSIGPVDLQGSAMGTRTRSNRDVTDAATGARLFNDSNVGTFTKIAIAGQMGMFNASASREKRSGYEPDYYGSVGINVGNNSRLQYSDSNRGDPTVSFNYNRKF